MCGIAGLIDFSNGQLPGYENHSGKVLRVMLDHLRHRIEECAIHIQHANLQLQALRLIITT